EEGLITRVNLPDSVKTKLCGLVRPGTKRHLWLYPNDELVDRFYIYPRRGDNEPPDLGRLPVLFPLGEPVTFFDGAGLDRDRLTRHNSIRRQHIADCGPNIIEFQDPIEKAGYEPRF